MYFITRLSEEEKAAAQQVLDSVNAGIAALGGIEGCELALQVLEKRREGLQCAISGTLTEAQKREQGVHPDQIAFTNYAISGQVAKVVDAKDYI